MAALACAHRDDCTPRDPQGQDALWRERRSQLYKHDWVVYAKTPLGGPAQVLEYLSRYAHRTAISNERIRTVSEREVAFTLRCDTKGGKRLVRLQGTEFCAPLHAAQGFAGHFDCCPGLRRALLRSSPL